MDNKKRKLILEKDLSLSFIFVLMFSYQTYTGTIIPAVDRICVGVSPGEVCRGLVKLIYGTVCYL